MSERPKILIPGETGTIGRGAYDALHHEYDLTAGTSKETSAFQEGFRYFDFLESGSMEQAILGGNFDVIINLAGIASPAESGRVESNSKQINHLGVVKMLDIVFKMPLSKRPKIILPLSVLQFDIRQPGTVNLDHPLKTTGSEYVMQKNALLNSAKEYVNKGLDIYFAFIANTTGVAHPTGYFGPDVMDKLVNDREMVNGDTDQYRPFLHQRDAGRILSCVLKNIGHNGKLSSGDSFFISSGTNYNMREFFKVMARVAGRPQVEPSLPSAEYGGIASIKDIKFNTELLCRMGFKEMENMESIARTLYWEAMRIKKGEKLPERGIPSDA